LVAGVRDGIAILDAFSGVVAIVSEEGTDIVRERETPGPSRVEVLEGSSSVSVEYLDLASDDAGRLLALRPGRGRGGSVLRCLDPSSNQMADFLLDTEAGRIASQSGETYVLRRRPTWELRVLDHIQEG
jgi:hypothetical protein